MNPTKPVGHTGMSPQHFTRRGQFESRWWELNPTTPVWRTGVSPQHFTCLVVFLEASLLETGADRGGAQGRVRDPSWAGWELNPREDGVRVRCNANFCYQPVSTVVPPPGIEPGLLGLRPSALPVEPRWEEVPRARNKPGARHVLLHRVPARAPTSSLFGCQRAPSARAGRTSGSDAIAESAMAPFACSQSGFGNPDIESQSRIVMSPEARGPKRRRAAWFPWRPSLASGVTRSLQSLGGASRRVLPPTRSISPRNSGDSVAQRTTVAAQA